MEASWVYKRPSKSGTVKPWASIVAPLNKGEPLNKHDKVQMTTTQACYFNYVLKKTGVATPQSPQNLCKQ